MFLLSDLAQDVCTGVGSCTLADKVMYINSILLFYTHICMCVCPRTRLIYLARQVVSDGKRWKESISPTMTARVNEWISGICTIHEGGCMVSSSRDIVSLYSKAFITGTVDNRRGKIVKVVCSPHRCHARCYGHFPPSANDFLVRSSDDKSVNMETTVSVAVERSLPPLEVLMGLRRLCEDPKYCAVRVTYNTVCGLPMQRSSLDDFLREVQRVDPRVESVDVTVSEEELFQLGVVPRPRPNEIDDFIECFVSPFLDRINSIAVRSCHDGTYTCVLSYKFNAPSPSRHQQQEQQQRRNIVNCVFRRNSLCASALYAIDERFFYPKEKKVSVSEVHLDDESCVFVEGKINPMDHWLNAISEYLEDPVACTLKSVYLYKSWRFVCKPWDKSTISARKCIMTSLLSNLSVTEVVGLHIMDADDCSLFAQLLKENSRISSYTKLCITVPYTALTPVVLAARFHNTTVTSFQFVHAENAPSALLRQMVQLQLYAQRNDAAAAASV